LPWPEVRNWSYWSVGMEGLYWRMNSKEEWQRTQSLVIWMGLGFPKNPWAGFTTRVQRDSGWGLAVESPP